MRPIVQVLFTYRRTSLALIRYRSGLLLRDAEESLKGKRVDDKNIPQLSLREVLDNRLGTDDATGNSVERRGPDSSWCSRAGCPAFAITRLHAN
jgi:hypothetical protein